MTCAPRIETCDSLSPVSIEFRGLLFWPGEAPKFCDVFGDARLRTFDFNVQGSQWQICRNRDEEKSKKQVCKTTSEGFVVSQFEGSHRKYFLWLSSLESFG